MNRERIAVTAVVPAWLVPAMLVLAAGSTAWAGAVSAAGSNATDQIGIAQIGIGRAWSAADVAITGVEAVSTSGTHTLILKTDGTVWAFGRNGFGQLGDGTTNDSRVPVQAVGLANIVSIAAGTMHSLAVDNSGTVYSWGSNVVAQLGGLSRDDDPHPTPTIIAGLSDVVSVVADDNSSYAIQADGTVMTWEGRWTPLPPQLSGPMVDSAISNVAMLAVQRHHKVALLLDGTVQADGIPGSPAVTGVIGGLINVVAVAAGAEHGLALSADNGGTVFSWGGNAFGQLGDGTTTDSTIIRPVPAMTGIVAIAAGMHTSFAVQNDGTVWAWGRLLPSALGDETGITSTLPTRVGALSNVASVDVEGFMGLAVKNDGMLCRFSSDALSPESGIGLSDAVALSAGAFHNLAVKLDGSVWGWGSNWSFEIGDAVALHSAAPLQVSGISGAVSAAAGGSHSLAVNAFGELYAWGGNAFGQLGDGTTEETAVPTNVECATEFLSVAAGEYHSLAVDSNGRVHSWGKNDQGQLGDGTTDDRSAPVVVGGLTGVVAVAAGWGHSLALKNDGTVWAWGANNSGQLGNGTDGWDSNSAVPVQVSGLTDVAAIAAGAYHSLAIKNDGSLWAWGDNLSGQLGNGASGEGSLSNVPASVPGMTDVVAVSGGAWHTTAAKADGTAWAWGFNYAGRLGIGTTVDSDSPVQVSSVSDVTRVAAGGMHSLYGQRNASAAVLATWPTDDSATQRGTHLAVYFTEPVANVSVDDLTLSAGGVASVAGAGQGPYLFELSSAPFGAVSAGIDGDIADAAGGDLATHDWSFLWTVQSDYDLDGDVDGNDFLTFLGCFNEALFPPKQGCVDACDPDEDGDGDVDVFDFVTFSACYNGSLNVPGCP